MSRSDLINQKVLNVTQDAINNSFVLQGRLIQESPRRHGYIGTFKGIHVDVDENVPSGKMFMVNDNYLQFSVIDTRTRWQRFVDGIRRKLNRKNSN